MSKNSRSLFSLVFFLLSLVPILSAQFTSYGFIDFGIESKISLFFPFILSMTGLVFAISGKGGKTRLLLITLNTLANLFHFFIAIYVYNAVT